MRRISWCPEVNPGLNLQDSNCFKFDKIGHTDMAIEMWYFVSG